MRILLVDDDPDILFLAEFSLSKLGGHEIVPAGGGLEAIECARRDRPDAILLDCQMPAPDGPAVLARLRSDPSLRSIPVVFFTAKEAPAERARLLALGAQGVLAKPFDPEALPSLLDTALGGRDSGRGREVRTALSTGTGTESTFAWNGETGGERITEGKS